MGSLDYVWDKPTSGNEWGVAKILTTTDGTGSKESALITAGMQHSFGGASKYTAGHNSLADTVGIYPNYRIYMYKETTDGIPASMIFGNSSGSTALTPANDTTWMYTAYIVARRTDADNESAAYWIQGCMANNAGNVTGVGAPQITAVEDTAAWNVIPATATAVGFIVQGQAAKTIRWNGYVDIVQVSG